MAVSAEERERLEQIPLEAWTVTDFMRVYGVRYTDAVIMWQAAQRYDVRDVIDISHGPRQAPPIPPAPEVHDA